MAVIAGLKRQDLRLGFVVLRSWIKMASGNSELVLPLLLGQYSDNTVRGILGFVSIPGNVAVFNNQFPFCRFTSGFALLQHMHKFGIHFFPKPASTATMSVTGLQVPQIWEHL